MAVFHEPWRDLHAAKNDLTAAKLLLHCSRPSGNIDVTQVEGLIMQASAKIDELAFDGLARDGSRLPSRPAPPPPPVSDRLRQIYERQAELQEQAARLLQAQAAALAPRIELALQLAAQKREEAALTAWDPERRRVEREAAAFEREARALELDVRVLEAQRERALAQATTAWQKLQIAGV